MRKLRFAALAAIVLLPLAYFLGPRIEVTGAVTLPDVPQDVEAYIAKVEAGYGNVIPGTERKIIWAFEDKRKTPLSVIYLPGFSATRQESAPFADEIAEALGANLYYARLRGHGQPPTFLGQSTADQWVEDAAESFAIGERLGERVVVIGVSTGATAATQVLLQTNPRVAALVFMSPNFGAAQFGASLTAGPWGKELTQLTVGSTFSWGELKPEHQAVWTNNFPSDVLPQVAGLVGLVRKQSLKKITAPTLFLYSEKDTVIDYERVLVKFDELGSTEKKLVHITNSDNPSNHVLAGKLVSQASHKVAVEKTLAFLRQFLETATARR